jgi:hypothetical protein
MSTRFGCEIPRHAAADRRYRDGRRAGRVWEFWLTRMLVIAVVALGAIGIRATLGAVLDKVLNQL